MQFIIYLNIIYIIFFKKLYFKYKIKNLMKLKKKKKNKIFNYLIKEL